MRREADVLLADLDKALTKHGEDLRGRLEATFKEYLDPKSGRFSGQVEQMLGDGGELERQLKHQLTGEDSDLAKLLSEKVGEDSELMRLLDPDEADSVVRAVADATETALEAQKQKLLEQFSLDNEEGALSRLARQLKSSNGELGDQVEAKVAEVVSQLSLDNDKSAMARLRSELLGVLDLQQNKLQEMHSEFSLAVASLQARKQAAAESNLHGREFEDLLYERLSAQAQTAGDLAEHTGAKVGRKRNCKKGDAVCTLGTDKAAAGARIVVEAKDKAGYSLAEARDEIVEARENRGADVGVFVFAEGNCPSDLDGFCRFGCDVFTVWDPENPASDVYLHAALSVATALCTNSRLAQEADQADVEAIERAILEIEKQVGKVAEVETWAETIRSNAIKIIDRVRVSGSALRTQCDELTEKTREVKAVLDHLGTDV